MSKTRYLTTSILADLQEKMVFVGGPRQVGKTTLAVDLVGLHFRAPVRFNWDRMSDRRRVLASAWPGDADLTVLDEIHKYRKWKRFLKGEYDTQKERYKFLVTGSARLDVFRKGSDSLMGRFHYYLLHPFSLAEIHGQKSESKPFEELAMGPACPGLDVLEKFGGFPEPFFSPGRTGVAAMAEREKRAPLPGRHSGR